MSGRIEVRASEFKAPLRTPFTIARGTKFEAHTVHVCVRWNGIAGIGEAAPLARYAESVESVLAYFETFQPRSDDPYALDTILAQIPLAARCGLDLALHDAIGKDLDRPLWRLLGLDAQATPHTALTISIGDIADVVAQVRRHLDAPILKVKLGGGREIETIEAIRSIFTGTLRIDANEAWDVERAVTLLRELARFDIEFCEQPIPAGHPEQLRYLRERSTIALVADEDSVVAEDLPALYGCVDGVNVKLAKCGGIRAALRMIHTARALGFKIMLGCMVESSVLATAAAHLSPLADWADIDGPLLLACEPFEGVRYPDNKLTLSERAGLGIIKRAP